MTELAYDEDAELSVVGAMLRSEAATATVLDHLTAQDLYRHDLAAIFEAARGLWEKGEPQDPLSVWNHLEQTGQGFKAGGKARVHEVAQLSTATSNVAHHAKIVREHAVVRQLQDASYRIGEIANEHAPADQLVDKAEQVIFDLSLRGTGRDVQHISGALQETFEQISHLYEQGGDVTGIPTGFKDLDRITSGFQPGNLIIVAARPSMGKSALAIGMMQTLTVQHRIPVGLFTLEMSRGEVTQRLLSSEARVESQAIRTGKLTQADWPRLSAASNTLSKAPIWVDDSGSQTMTEIRSKARRLKMREPNLGLVIVDYLQLMTSGSRAENRVQEVSQISRALKVLARDLEIPIVALSQLSRKVEERTDKRPLLSDLRESGSIEQDADLVAFVYRDEYYRKDESDAKGIAELILAKNRNGPTDTVKLSFMKSYAKFGNLA